MFVFRPKRCDRLRCIFWGGYGMILATKWQEQGYPEPAGLSGTRKRRAGASAYPSAALRRCFCTGADKGAWRTRFSSSTTTGACPPC
ncbi:MAG: transposase [Mesorhizobium sp.]|nr:MAG: hypothetical protein EOR08_28395 [Mesorhizobium sp.]TIL60479.1 MAG: transposase [Mesorhizobium sp.]TIW68660.1 MAG: transposase [Mesorhizobium sp.]